MNNISSLALSYGGTASSIGAGYAGFIHGDALLATVLLLLGGSLFVGRIVLDETISTATLRKLVPRPRSIGATLFALLIVSAAAGGGMLGPDAQRLNDQAQPVGEAEALACGGVCIGTGVAIAVGFGAGYVANEYLSGDDTASAAVQAETADTKNHLSTFTGTQASDQVMLNTVMSNQVNDGSQSVAYAKAKAAAVKAMNNNSTEAETRAAMVEAVDDHYASMEINYLNSKSELVERSHYLNDVWFSDAGIDESTSSSQKGYTGVYGTGIAWDKPGYNNMTLQSADYQLVNGTEHSVHFYFEDDNDFRYVWFNDAKASNYSDPGASETRDPDYINYFNSSAQNPPVDGRGPSADATGNFEAMVVLDTSESKQVLSDIDTQHSSINSSMNTWLDNTYANYTAGSIDESDVLDPVTLSQEFATEYNTTGHYSYAAADLALQGYNGTLNHSMVFDLHNGSAGRTSNATLNGTLFTDWEPSSTNGTFETGTTYNATAAPTLVYVSTNDGLRVVEGEFHIEEMTNVKTGEQINSTTLESYNRQTADPGWNESEYKQMLELQQELDEAQAAAAGTGGIDQTVLIAIIAAAGAALLLTRRD